MPPSGQHTNPLVQELERVHEMLRRDLRACQDLAAATGAGAAPEDLRHAVGQLARRSPHLRLGVDCLRYCRLVHAHHGGEDTRLFPIVRRDAPQLAGVVDRLEADHRTVSGLLDAVESAAGELDGADPDEARRRLAGTLDALSRHLLEHLEVEERALRPVLLTYDAWPAA